MADEHEKVDEVQMEEKETATEVVEETSDTDDFGFSTKFDEDFLKADDEDQAPSAAPKADEETAVEEKIVEAEVPAEVTAAEPTPPASPEQPAVSKELLLEALKGLTPEQRQELGIAPVPQPQPETNTQQQQQQRLAQEMAQLEGMYKLTPEQAQALDAEPSKIMPRFAAAVHANIIRHVGAQLGQILPQLVPQIVNSASADKTNEDKFFQEWPELRQHAAVVEATAKTLLSTRPDLRGEEVMRQLGLMASVAAGLPISVEMLQRMGKVAQPAAPARAAPPPSPSNARGNGVSRTRTSGADPEFTKFFEEMLQAD